MQAASTTQSTTKLGLLVPLVLANGVAVSTLYWGQAVVGQAVAEFGSSTVLSLMPGATLAGYAAGVAGLATLAGDLSQPRGLCIHYAVLCLALAVAAAAPAPIVLALACFGIGVGCALTQRLLACATGTARPGHGPQTIGFIIAGGLCGIVIARSGVPAAASSLGWRGMLWIDAGLTVVCGAAATWVAARGRRSTAPAPRALLPSAALLLRQEPGLRLAILQQAVVFAAFNMSWAVFPRVVQRVGPWPAASMALVALLGACAALLSGRLCMRMGTGTVARAGVLAVSAGGLALATGLQVPASCYLGMGLLDAGTQIALVANQARAQALAPTPALRGRLTAIVTTVGFLGGAIGSAAGNLLAWTGLLFPP